MALSDPFSTTYEGAFKAGTSLGTGIQQAAGGVANYMKLENQRKMALDTMKQFGILKEDDASSEDYMKEAQKHAQEIGYKGINFSEGATEQDKVNTMKTLFNHFGLPQPKGNLNIDAKRAAELGAEYDPNKGDVSFKPPKEDPLATAMKRERLTQQSSNEQDRLEQNSLQRLSSLRGDASLARTELQRDAAISAYNRIQDVKKSGQKGLNPIDYIDILGQVYKARTGAAPTETVLQDARQGTASGQGNKWYTYFTGQQAPATTDNIVSSLEDMLKSMGENADMEHDSYMAPHLIKPQGLSSDRWDNIKNQARGTSFKNAIKNHSDQTSQMLQATGLQGKQQVLDKNTASQFLQQAGGDKNKAREIAKQQGYQF